MNERVPNEQSLNERVLSKGLFNEPVLNELRERALELYINTIVDSFE